MIHNKIGERVICSHREFWIGKIAPPNYTKPPGNNIMSEAEFCEREGYTPIQWPFGRMTERDVTLTIINNEQAANLQAKNWQIEEF